MRRWLGWLGVLLVVSVAGWVGLATGAPLSGDNDTDGYLSNGGFEGAFYEVGAGQVAEGWTRTHLGGDPNWMSTCTFARGEGADCEEDGPWIEKIGGANSHILSVENLGIGEPFETVLHQRVTGLVPGQVYSFSGWALKMYGGSANPTPPTDPFSFASWVGVDPTGGTDPTAATVQWGEYEWQTTARGNWINHRLTVVPDGEAATVFVRLWLKWQRAETQAIVDAMELFDAPSVTLHSQTGYLATPHLDWSGTLPAMLSARGNYRLYYEVQQQASNGTWETIATDLSDDSATLPLVENEVAVLRVVPLADQPEGQTVIWPPSTHVGLPSDPITVILGDGPPLAEVSINERWVGVEPFSITWGAAAESRHLVAGYDVGYRRAGESDWTSWLTNTAATSATFGEDGEPVTLEAGDEWEFRVRVRDVIGEVGEWGESAQVGVAGALLRGTLWAVGGEPISGASITSTPYEFLEPPAVDSFGNYEVPFVASGTYTFTFRDRDGVERLPDTPLEIVGRDGIRAWGFPPADNRVVNGHFEEGLTGWTGTGTQAVGGSSGLYAAQLAPGQSLSQSVSAEPGDGFSLAWRALTPDAVLRVQWGAKVWDSTSGPTEAWGHDWLLLNLTETQTLTLTALSGTIEVDEVAIGTPQQAMLSLYLPLITR